jgi:hypothetical protein
MPEHSGTVIPVAVPQRPGNIDLMLLRLLLQGHTIRTAAARLHISIRSAEAKLARLRDCAGAHNLYSLGVFAERLGWHHEEEPTSFLPVWG